MNIHKYNNMEIKKETVWNGICDSFANLKLIIN